MFSDDHFKTLHPISPGGRLFGQINKHHPFYSKLISKCHPIIVKPLAIRSPQSDTIPNLHSSPSEYILYQLDTYPKRLTVVLPLSVKPSPTIFLVGWEWETRQRPPSLTTVINPFKKGGPYEGFLITWPILDITDPYLFQFLPCTYHYRTYATACPGHSLT